ncbi:hypothetical protein ACFL9U_10805 [Thermodesulfobacteriota bacterium]
MKINKITVICMLLALMIFNSGVFAGDPMHIELSDGSVIVGKIISFDDGVYTIRSDTVGTINIDESRIRIIRSASAAKYSEGATKQSGAQINQQVDVIKKQMMGDQEIMQMIFSLHSDPKFLEIMQDPEILNAINSVDIETLKSNQKFMDLLNHEKVGQIKRRLEDE